MDNCGKGAVARADDEKYEQGGVFNKNFGDC